MIHERYITSLWYTSDVQSRRPDLTEEEAYEVLKFMEKKHECNIGYNGDFIDWCAYVLFGEFDIDEWEAENGEAEDE